MTDTMRGELTTLRRIILWLSFYIYVAMGPTNMIFSSRHNSGRVKKLIPVFSITSLARGQEVSSSKNRLFSDRIGVEY